MTFCPKAATLRALVIAGLMILCLGHRVVAAQTASAQTSSSSQTPSAQASSMQAALTAGKPGRLHGEVIDPTGAVIPGAAITLKNDAGQTFTAKSDGIGSYTVKDLPAGKYNISVSEKGFAPYLQEVQVIAGADQKMNITLLVQIKQENVDVGSDAASVNVNPDSNASSVVIAGKDLDALSDDPDELQSELQALAGPSAGPNGGQIYIDGFTGGQLPPKSSIREIRINQNPFSAEYDRMGFGRIEILTKPGTDKYHGQFMFNDNHSFFDSRNPFSAGQGDFSTQMYNGSFGGPISKKSSFLVTMERRDINDVALINQSVLDNFHGNVAPVTPNPHIRTNLSPRVDYQISANNTLTARYQYVHDTQENAGVGQLNVPSYGFDTSLTEHTVQISDTQVLGGKAVNETRFEYQRTNNDRNALSNAVAQNVLETVNAGGNPLGISNLDGSHYEVQNYTSISHGTHFTRFGGRLRATSETSISTQGFNGSYVFGRTPVFSSALAAFNAGQPNQFSLTVGTPNVSNTYFDAGLYAEDDWKLRPNMTLSAGLRYETQNEIHDHNDWAPRIGFAWGVGGKKNAAPKTVIRTGFGIFYDRFNQDLALQAERLNGNIQQQFIINGNTKANLDALATFFATPSILPTAQQLQALGGTANGTTYLISPDVRAPYTIQTALAVERQISRVATASLTYIHSRGVHQLVVINANAPNPLNGNARPDPSGGNVYQYTSGADFKQNQMIANVTVRAGAKLTLFSYYSLSHANSDTGGASSFASNSYNISADYGRAAFDVRNRLFFGGSISLPRGFRVSPFVLFFTGAPFNITTGDDLNGDSIINDRPAFATSATPGHVVSTPLGNFDTSPVAGEQIVPINFGDGPSQFTFNLRLSKTIGIGPKVETANGNQPGRQGDGGHGGPGGGGPRGGPMGGMGGGRGPGGPFGERSNQKYSLTFSANARNLFNNVNPNTPVGNLSSPNFLQSTGLAGGPFNSQSANRRFDLQVMFAF
jgi:hypothetical protein